MDSLQERIKKYIFKSESADMSYGQWCLYRLEKLLTGFFGAEEQENGAICYPDRVSGKTYSLWLQQEEVRFRILLTANGSAAAEIIGEEESNRILLNGREYLFSAERQREVSDALEALLFSDKYAYCLPPIVEEELTQEAFARKNVLVGVLRSAEQLAASLKHLYYHIPVDAAPAEPATAEYVALLQNRKKFGEQAGIRYFGKIVSVSVVKRSEIAYLPKSGDAPYYLYQVESWHRLAAPIILDDSCAVAGLTGYELLLNSRYLSQLFADHIRSFMMYDCISSYLSGPLLNRAGLVYRFPFRGSVIALEDGHIRIYRKGLPVLHFDPGDYLASPSAFFRSIGG